MIEICRDVRRELSAKVTQEENAVVPTLQGCQNFEESKIWEVE
jgi:hypothetical protein